MCIYGDNRINFAPKHILNLLIEYPQDYKNCKNLAIHYSLYLDLCYTNGIQGPVVQS